MRFLISVLLAFVFSAHAEIRPALPMSACAAHLPYGMPSSTKANTTKICREGYALEHDNKAKIPIWVSYTLTPKSAVGCEARAEGFKVDPSIPEEGRAVGKDYAKSGYDIGHMANSADMRLSSKMSIESNLFSNAAPQLPGLNRAAWKSLEVRTRTWAVGRDHSILVYVGAIYKLKGATTIGSGVVVPTGFYKILIDQETKEVLAFIYPQANSTAGPSAFKTSLAEVQKQAGLVLPVPAQVKLSSTLWPVSASSVRSKSAACAVR